MKCKGTNKDTYGLGCGTDQKKRKLGLGIECGCYSCFLLNTEAGKRRIRSATLQVTKPRRELEEAEKEHKENKSLSTLLNNTKNTCHEFIRKRDKGKECVSCGAAWHKDFQAGHFYKAELFSSLKFNEDNIHGQCVQCNIRKQGNESEYRVNLPNRIGFEKFKELNELAALDKKMNFKWCREELKEKKKYYQQKIKELK